MSVLPVGFGSALGGYQIERSLRFNSADTAYLNRTPASAGNRKTWTWSAWVKLGVIGTERAMFATSDSTAAGYNQNNLRFTSADIIKFAQTDNTGTNTILLDTTAVYRDPSAWYHIVLAVDTTQATASNRVKIYVNGAQVTSFSTATYPTQNLNTFVNNNQEHYHGRRSSITPTAYFDGYLTEINFIDGQALTPSSFGQTNSSTGVWEPIAYTGTYGTNGFFLKFADNSGTTSTTLGKDSSGNGNNWTPNNFSVTAGSGNDSLVDTPTAYGTDTGVGGEVRGNYATWNPLDRTAATYTNGNLEVSSTSSAAPYNMTTTIQLPTSGKWYCEVTALKGASNPGIGIGNNRPLDQFALYRNTGAYITANISGIASSGTPATWTTGDVIGIAYDADAGTLSFYKNGSAQSGGFTSVPATGYCVAVRADSTSGDGGTLNAGQRPFAYTAPSGFKALCTQNLPTPTIGATSTTQANRYMDIKLYTGNGGQQTQTGLNFQPDFIWVKSRSNAYDNGLANAVTGTGKYLVSNSTAAEVTDASGSIIAFNADGFGQGGSNPFGANAATYAAWCWRASNAAGVTNTAGTITSTVSANTTSGFSIVTYTGNGTNGATVGHGLGTTPAMVIIKSRSLTGTTPAANWIVWHRSISQAIQTDTTIALTGFTGATFLNLTSQSLTYGFDAQVNGSTQTYVAYCFAPVAGYSAFGSYTGNNSATDGTFVYLGFRPRFLMIKSTSGSTSWVMMDSARNTYNLADTSLYAESANSEATIGTVNDIDFLSNGFKLRNNTGFVNASQTYIYAAFAESPFKYSLAR